ncbi:WYL domain-containing protein [Arthrobacter sp. LAPM80]|uniref:helix-turn-helix transcriptional regulator n=1 Tax=Arthrobacter sp. LAPM80 TaxID=3141788 RepID=UPI00398B8766
MSTKIDATERLLNLVIALLGTKAGRSKSYLRERINGYTGEAATAAEEVKVQAAFERMFERDKKVLLKLGIPISQSELQGDDAQEQVLYRINPDDYRVPAVRLDEDAMTLLAIAANLWSEAALGDAAQSALRKIATRAGTGWYEDDTTARSRIRTAEPSIDALWSALRGNHPVTFSYRRSGAQESTTRTVQPWGLGSKYGQWYLRSFDLDKSAERNFRLSRITSDVEVHTTETFERPAGFNIADVLAGLGKGRGFTAHIGVPAGSGHALRGRSGATVVTGTQWDRSGWDVLRITYREPELMAEDVASLGSQAFVLDPAELRDAVASQLHLAAAAASAAQSEAHADLAWKRKLAPQPAKKKDSRDRLVRLLSMVPYLVANPGVDEAEVMAEFGISAAQWDKDRDTLNVTGLPGYYHGDLMDVTTEAGQVFIRDAETLASPLRLTQEEACSVLVGLKALATLPSTHLSGSLSQAIESVAAVAGEDAWLADAVGLHLISGQEMDTIAALQEAISHGRACAITYLVRTRDELSERTVEPLRLFSEDSVWYLRAWCRKAAGLRSFRVDHIKSLADAGPRENGGAGSATWRPGTGIYHPGSDDVAIQLVADAETARSLGPAYNAQPFDLGADKVGLRLLVGDTSTLPPLMARLGGHAWVAGPATVRDGTAAWLARAVDSYDAMGETFGDVPSLGR